MTAETGAALLARVQPTLNRTSAFISLRPDIIAEWEIAEQALVDSQAKDQDNTRLSSGVSARTKKLAEEVEAIQKRLDETGVEFWFTQMSKPDWQALCDRHGPRADDTYDQMVGYNRDAVLDEAVRECMETKFEDCKTNGCPHLECGTWQQFLRFCNVNQWEILKRATNEVNRAVTEAPKSELASRILAKRGTGSRRSANGG